MADGRQKGSPDFGQGKAARAAVEQRRSKVIFKRFDMRAYRGLRQPKFRGRAGKAEMARRAFKRPDMAEWWLGLVDGAVLSMTQYIL